MFGIYSLIMTFVLLLNSIAILSEDRFLNRIGWGTQSEVPAFGQATDNQSVKARIIKFISAVRTVMRVPLIIINIVVIGCLIIWG